jgi:protoheme IX farnesyltransferase
MNARTESESLQLSPSAVAVARDLLALTKPRITGLVLATTAGGLFLAPIHLDTARAILVLLATGAVVSAANALNCYLERDIDRQMARTRNRPLPAGRLDPRVALGFGIGLAAAALPMLALAGGMLAALLAAIALVSYVLVYTPMKQTSPKALLVGAVPGAMPPLIGWVAATGRINLPGLALFGILFFWQLPHFLAIALYRKDDYARAGFKVLPVVRGEWMTRIHIVFYTVLLVPITVLLSSLGVAGRVYECSAALLGAWFLRASVRGLTKAGDRAWARRLFLGSILYLVVLFIVLMANATHATF